MTGAAGIRNGNARDARQGPARGRPWRGAGVSPPAGHAAGAARDASRGRWRWGGGFGPPAPYWQPGPFKALRPADVVGTWIASFGLGMNKQIFTFLLVGDRLRGVVCGRCDNPYTIGAMENIFIVGNTLYFDIVHQDWGESDPPTFNRNIVAQVVQNEMIAADSREGPRNQSCQSTRAAGGPRLHARRADCSRGDEREQLRGRRRLGTRYRLRHPAAARQDADPAGEPGSIDPPGTTRRH